MMRISCKISILVLLFLVSTSVLYALEFRISKVLPDAALSVLKVPEGKKPPHLQLYRIYDVYKKMEIIEGRRVFLDFVDSVYLKQVGKGEISFGYIWEGEHRLMQPNYILIATDRIFQAAGASDTKIIEDEPEDDEVKTDTGTAEEKSDTKSAAALKAPAFIIFGGYTLLQYINYLLPAQNTFGAGDATLDLLFLLPFGYGIRVGGNSRFVPEYSQTVQAGGIKFIDFFNRFLRFYTELGASYRILSDPVEFSIIAQYGIVFDFLGLFTWGHFAIDLYASASFPINTIAEGLYINYGLKAGYRF